jgi:hypothetical protein
MTLSTDVGEFSIGVVYGGELAWVIKAAAAAAGTLVLRAAIELLPYGKGGGHHPVMQSLSKNDPKNYKPRKALAIPKKILEKMGGGKEGGRLLHEVISKAQRFLYGDFAKTGLPLTEKAVEDTETTALEQAGVDRATARATVRQAIAQLKDMGVSLKNMAIPWP